MNRMNPPPQPPIGNQPFQKWMMDAIGVMIFILAKIAGYLANQVLKTRTNRLYYRGQPIIMMNELTTGLNLSDRTIARYRKDEKLDYYGSNDGRTIFATQEQFDDFIDRNFTCHSSKNKQDVPVT